MGGPPVLPFYIVCDESSSMQGESIAAVNEVIVALMQEISSDPVVDARARVAVIAFNDEATLAMPLTKTSDVQNAPQCVADGTASYSAAFSFVKAQIDADVPRLKAEGLDVHRPMVYFISDGEPNNENWQQHHAALVDPANPYRPNIVSFGVEGARPDVIASVATTPTGFPRPLAFQGDKGTSDVTALRKIMIFFLSFVGAGRVSMYPMVQLDMPPTGTRFIDLHRDQAMLTVPTSYISPRDEAKPSVLPFYIVCDKGSSMQGESIAAVNEGIVALMQEISSDPVVDAKARVAVIAFNDEATLAMPLTKMSDVLNAPQCVADGTTSYSAAFSFVKAQIDADVPRLIAEGVDVVRPMVYFISDGEPSNENWQQHHAALVDPANPYRPNIVSFGVEGARPDVIASVATTPTGFPRPLAFQGDKGTSAALVLREIMRILIPTY